jgi:hypothetical protein
VFMLTESGRAVAMSGARQNKIAEQIAMRCAAG